MSASTTRKSTARKPATRKADTTLAMPVNKQKQAVVQELVNLVDKHLRTGKQIKGVSRTDALLWAGQWLNYFPGVRQGQITWPKSLGTITMAGAVVSNKPAKKATATRKTAKPAAKRGVTTRSTRKPAARTTTRRATPAAMPQQRPASQPETPAAATG